jgi:DAACS family dicarboxylate/amino acid:cation (Na+ or H+) symporter
MPDSPGATPARRSNLHWQIAIGLLIGTVAGLLANVLSPREADGSTNAQLVWLVKNVTRPAGQVFLNLIFMVVLPLVFSALVLGVAQIGDVRRLGRIGLRTLGYTVLLSSISVVLGLTIVNLVRPGDSLSEERRAALREQYMRADVKPLEQARQAKGVVQTLLDIIPKNPLQEAVGAFDGTSPGGGMLSIMFFALMIGLAATLVGAKAAPLLAVLEGVYEIVMVLIALAMKLAPVAVAALLFSLTAELGWEILLTLGVYVLSVLGGLAFQLFIVFTIFVYVTTGLGPIRFLGRISEVIITALATSSSNATLPTALRVAQTNLGVRREIAGFVLTVGATGNQNGTALFEGITVLFLAQLFGVNLTLDQQFTVALAAILGGIGTAGVPGGSLPLIVLILQSVGLPGEAIGIIVGVDRVPDMCRTVINVSGDIAIAAAVDSGEGGTLAAARA